MKSGDYIFHCNLRLPSSLRELCSSHLCNSGLDHQCCHVLHTSGQIYQKHSSVTNSQYLLGNFPLLGDILRPHPDGLPAQVYRVPDGLLPGVRGDGDQ